MAHIVVTRPQGKGEELAEQLSEQGHKVTVCPVLDISYLDTSAQQLATLDEADIAIFVSQDAVIGLHQQRPSLPSSLQCIAVGDATAKALASHFNIKAISPKQQDSEGVIALPILQNVEAKHVALVKGKGGRTVIAKTLKQRGGIVHAITVYARNSTANSSEQWLSQWQKSQVDALVVTSNSGVDALFACHNNELLEWLKSRHFYIVSDRTQQHLSKLGVNKNNITVAATASNEAIAASINSEQETGMSDKPEQASATAQEQNPITQEQAPEVTPLNQSDVQPQRARMSKVGLLALIIAVAAGTGTAYLYWQDYQRQQQQMREENAQFAQLQSQLQTLSSKNQALREQINALSASQQQQQQNNELWQQQFDDTISRQLNANQRAMITHVEQSIAAAKDTTQPPLDMNEVRRLVSLADFKIWSERNYAGAASVLERLDALLGSYSGNAQLRRAIHSDLQMLASVKVVDVQKAVLKLHGLSGQVDQLAFIIKPQAEQAAEPDNALSEDVSDWQANLARSWQQLVDDFIKVRKRDVVIDPLLDTEQQRLIKQRVHFYLDQAGFAATHQHQALFEQALQSCADLITRYFDLAQPHTREFLSTLKQQALLQLAPKQPVSLATVTALEES
ncbi:uroporphyrinogen-III C-methyltransferase [Pseudoalteromonas sp. SSDWG2]|uniref:uroporphyrinogen-III C-methyltransferase n=1 Tax=Pseudoalteromonas sp. SSDWG2 TaxID=3139391 RepID=UPI003BAC5794